jgi:hypothetical protein
MKQYKYISLIIACSMAIVSCMKDLDSDPINPSAVTASAAFSTPASYKEALAKLYAGLALTGQYGPNNDDYKDILGFDEGLSQYIRQLFNCEDLTTDEAVWSWPNDGSGTIYDLHNQKWSSSNQVVKGMYDRIFYQIAICNEYIRQVSPKAEGLDADLKANVYNYIAEARFLRALSYYHALDLFGSVPFVTENDPVGIFYPKQATADSLFNYIERELTSVTNDANKIHLIDVPKNETDRQTYYARANKGCAWTLLARLYLNSEIYLGTGKKKYTECVANCQKVISAGYSLDNMTYQNLFLADNNLNNTEIIFPVAFDGNNTQSYGGTTYLTLGAIVGTMNSADYGFATGKGWSGLRVTKAFVQKFTSTDVRAIFYTSGQKLEIEDLGTATDGYGFPKYSNKTSTGGNGKSENFPDTDFPMFRLADVYLMYAEAVLRGATNGDVTTAITYVNKIRTRASVTTLTKTDDLTLDFILDERCRELSWECVRRTDLIRYGRFSETTYVWPWKGGIAAGTTTDKKYNLFPIPASDIAANPNLKQRTGY